MFPNKIICNIIVIKFRKFCDHCTLHGLYYFSSNSKWWILALWSIVIGCSFSLCVYLSGMIWNKFRDNPTFTVVESTQYHIDNIPFPAVAVCDSEMVYGPNAHNITRILRFRDYNEEYIKDYYKSFTEVKKKDYVPDEYLKKMHSVLEKLGYPYKRIIDMLKKPCDVLIKECFWRSQPIECSRMFRSVFTIMGYCCQFDVDYFREHAGEQTTLRTGIDVAEALDITINTQKMHYDGNITNSYAFLYVFDKQDNLTLLNRPITLTPATYFDVTVNVWAIDSASDVKALSMNTRKCLLPSDTKDNANSYQGCMTVLMMRKVIAHCRCMPFNYEPEDLDVENFLNCTWEKLTCIYRMIDQVQSDIRSIILEYECYQRCDYVQYDTEAAYVILDRIVDEMAKSSTRVSIHFTDSTCLKYKREVLYTWDQLLANLGGIFGLCLGGSIISIIELLWFLLGLLFTFCGFKKRVNKSEGKPVFTVTKKNMPIASKKFKTNVRPYPYLN